MSNKRFVAPLVALFFLNAWAAGLLAEEEVEKTEEPHPAEYLTTPDYDRAMRLSDGIAIAELVVIGTPVRGENSKPRINVHQTLFGKPHQEHLQADGAVALARISRVAWGEQGVWFLVRTRGGYLSVNPDLAPLELDEYRQLEHPAEHWTDQRNLVCHQDSRSQMHYSYKNPKTSRAIWHGPNTYDSPGREAIVELFLHGRRRIWVLWNAGGHLDRVVRIPSEGHGFFLDFEDARVVWFQHLKNGKKHGRERRYYLDRREPPRFEKHFADGVIDGRSRQWDENGELVSDVTYEWGLIRPIVRYHGKGIAAVEMTRTMDGVEYAASPVVEQVKVGMTTKEVSELLKVDFSPTSGIHFPTYDIDMYLHIAFKDGVVSAIKTGHNGVHLSY